MSVELRITAGARAGTSERFDKSVISIGRHPMCDLRFDAQKDLDVSARHAEIRSAGGRHVLHDLGSTNGTFVNGRRIAGERELRDGDTIQFGADGPHVSFHVKAEAPRPAAPRQPTEVRIAHAVQQQTGKLRSMVIALAVLVVLGGAAAFMLLQRTARLNQAQLARLLASNDSLARALEQRLAQTGIADSALKAARTESERLAAQLRERQQTGGDITELSAAVRSAQARNAVFSRMDYAAIAAANKAAMAFLVVEMPDSSRSSGTGFNLLPDGLIVTNRHVVQAPDGTRAQRIAVAFEGTQGRWMPATIEYVSTTDELALLRIARRGPFPVVSGIAQDASASALGEPVALLGYPLGTSLVGMKGDIDRSRPTATLGFGTVSKVLDDTIQLDAYAAQGSSGSPVFDARGLVVGVVFGGASESNGRIVYAVPASALIRQLPRDASVVVR